MKRMRANWIGNSTQASRMNSANGGGGAVARDGSHDGRSLDAVAGNKIELVLVAPNAAKHHAIAARLALKPMVL